MGPSRSTEAMSCWPAQSMSVIVCSSVVKEESCLFCADPSAV
jgi:hypothetical protein